MSHPLFQVTGFIILISAPQRAYLRCAYSLYKMPGGYKPIFGDRTHVWWLHAYEDSLLRCG
jgi:hypothetical protein